LIYQVGQGLEAVVGFLVETKNFFLELPLVNIFFNFFHHCFNLVIGFIYTQIKDLANPFAGKENAHL